MTATKNRGVSYKDVSSPLACFPYTVIIKWDTSRDYQMSISEGISQTISDTPMTPFQLIASLWKLFEILSYEILKAKFGFTTKILVYQWVFMLLVVIVLILWRCKVWKSLRDLTAKNDSGCKVSPFINLSTLHCHRINIIIARSLKMCSLNKVWVLNPNLGSKFSYEQ